MALPIPDLDHKTFQELFDEARALIPRYAPEWTDHNLSDPGMTFIDLFTWLAEMQLFYLDQLSENHYRKYLKLLGQSPEPAKSAQTELTFTISNAESTPDKDFFMIPKGTQATAIHPQTAAQIIFETGEDLWCHQLQIKRIIFESTNGYLDHSEPNAEPDVFYFPFGKAPETDDHLYFGFEGEVWPEGREFRLTVFSHNVINQPDQNFKIFPSVDLKWEYWNGAGWNELNVIDETAALAFSGSICFTTPNDVKKMCLSLISPVQSELTTESLFWIRARIVSGHFEIFPCIDNIRTNTISASQGQTIQDEFYPASGLPFQIITVRYKPILANSLRLSIYEKDREWHEWQDVPDFDASNPDSRHFQMDLEAGIIQFGDGIHGRVAPVVPDMEKNIHIMRYRTGGDETGNVKAGQINRMLTQFESGINITVENFRAAAGGTVSESVDRAKIRARKSLKQITRSITSGDFKSLILEMTHLPIARIEVLPLYHPDYPQMKVPNAVTVVVVSKIDSPDSPDLPSPSDGLLKTIDQNLKPKTLVTTNLHVVRPVFIRITINASIRVESQISSERVRQQVVVALKNFLNPLTDELNRKGWPLGRAVYKSEIFQVIEQVTGVACVQNVTMQADEAACTIALEKITLPKIGLAYSGSHQVTIL